jgi:hypothetical protein
VSGSTDRVTNISKMGRGEWGRYNITKTNTTHEIKRIKKEIYEQNLSTIP